MKGNRTRWLAAGIGGAAIATAAGFTGWQIAERPAVKRGRMVNRAFGEPSEQLHERHDASDFELRTQDKLDAGKEGKA